MSKLITQMARSSNYKSSIKYSALLLKISGNTESRAENTVIPIVAAQRISLTLVGISDLKERKKTNITQLVEMIYINVPPTLATKPITYEMNSNMIPILIRSPFAKYLSINI